MAVAPIVSLSAHTRTSPMLSKSGGSRTYEVRVETEAKMAVTAVDF